MPHFCSVVKCSMRAERDKVSFFRFPAVLNHLNSLSSERRNAWIKALKRGPLSESHLRNGRICSRHFLTRKPAALDDKTNPDWIPNQNLGYISIVQPSSSASSRFERSVKRSRAEVEVCY
ncbi:hypothetical protein RN001_006036 [Aquatica leii]|uniref:THAP-type domain-containing protein n=1 Tax=Aquatica leii TaxID=1421715 RepID=A0AAN7PCL7_9COLE|nr:hypothetical protein RN001_006036 [Aquatica leii]